MLVLEIAGTNSGQYDFLDIKGALTMNGNVLVTNLGYSFVGGESFNFLDAGAWSGAFDAWTLPTLTGGMTWDTSLFETAGILSVVPVPEPATWIALAAGIVLLSLRRRPAAESGLARRRSRRALGERIGLCDPKSTDPLDF